MSASDVRKLRIAASALALGWVLSTASAAAAEPTPPEREAARTLLLSGREKRKNGQLMGALEDFERAHAIMRVPTTGLDLGKTQQELGLLVEARTTFLEAARHPAKANESRAFKRARKEAKQLADEIAPRLATLTISVSAEARVKLDDADISSSSINVPLKVNPGKHEIVATLADDEKRETIMVVEGETKTVEFTLAGAPPPPPGAEKPPGSEEPRAETSTSSLVWIGGGVAAVGLAVGAVTGLMAFGIHGDVASRCQGGTRCPEDTHADIDRGETLGTVSTVGFVVAGVGAAVLVYGLLNPQANAPKPDAAPAEARRPRWIAGPFGVAGTF